MELRWDIDSAAENPKVIIALGPSLGGVGAQQWSQVARRIRDDAVVAYIDLPGHGAASPWGDDEPRLENVAQGFMEAIRAIRDEVGSLPVVFAGLSISGATALYLAHDDADELAGVAVVGSAAKLGTPETWQERAEQVETDGTVALVEGTKDRWFTENFQAENPDTVESIMGSLADADDHSYAQLCRALAEHDLRDEIGDIRLPVLVIAGEKDESTPMEDAEELAAQIPGAELKIVADAAHQMPVAAPDTVAVYLTSFIGRLIKPNRTAPESD